MRQSRIIKKLKSEGCIVARLYSIPDKKIFIPDPGSTSKNLSILTQKSVFKFSEIWSGLFIPDPDPGFLPIPDPGVKKAPDPESRTPDPDTQHCKDVWNKNRLIYFPLIDAKKDKWFHASYILLVAEGGVSVGPILDEFALESVSSIFLGRGLNALAGSPDSLNIIASVKYVENHLLRWTNTVKKRFASFPSPAVMTS
jgi:hypothetical protein